MRPGEVIDRRFEVGAIAGSGGMGTVYRARDLSTGETVALKVLERVGQEYVTRFEREARVLAQLHHPRIVRYVAHGTTPAGKHYLAMEWLEGKDVESLLGNGELAPDEAVGIVLRAAEALAVAHASGIVHRDIKPSNLFLVGGDIERLKILDFGVARLNFSARMVTQTGDPVGTPGYMAPEQARGDREVGAPVDVFALGCVLFECLTGQPPFVGKHVMSVLAKVLFEDAPRLRELRSNTPPAIDELAARMLAKDPAQRPKDAAAVIEELNALGSVAKMRLSPPSHPAPSLTRGEQRLLSVIVAGHPGKTLDTSERTMTPDEVNATRAIWDTVAQFGPIVERLANGAVVATLSGRGTATDQAALAARCALAMRKRLAGIPMALATGRGDVSGRLPMGDVIDRAVQLITADASHVQIDDVTAGLLSAHFDIAVADGRHALRKEHAAPPEGRTLLGRPTPCVGRDRELAMVEGIYAECVDEDVAHVVLVTAAAGVGKSRFLRELTPRLQARRACDVFVGRGDPMSAGSPYLMLRRAALGTSTEDVPTRRARFVEWVASRVPADARRITEFMGELLGMPFPDEGSVQLHAARQDPALMRDQIRRAWIDFLDALSRDRPVALVLEDLQWGDGPSTRLVDLALERFSDRPLFVLALARPEVEATFPRLWHERRLTRISLRELSRKASETLVREVLGREVAAERVTQIVERAGGNAFFLEELIRAEAEGKGGTAPQTVLAMVQARLEHLEPDARRVLRAASIFGPFCWKRGIEALLAAKSPAELDVTFGELRQRELLEPRATSRFAGELEMTFRHALVREAAYAMLTENDRVLGHRLAAEWLVAAGESDATTLAEHFESGAAPDEAAACYARAAEQALEANDMEATLARVERAVACGARDEVKGSLRALAAEAMAWRGDYVSAESLGREAMDLLPPESSRWCRAASWVAAAAGPLGHKDPLVALGRSLASIPTTDRTRALAQARTAMQLLYAGAYDVADALIARLVEARESLGSDLNVDATIHQLRAQRAMVAGDAGEALELCARAADAFERAGNVREASYERQGVALAYMYLGAWPEADATLRPTLEVALRVPLPRVVAIVKHNLGLVAAHLGNPEAKRLEQESIDTFAAQGDRRLEGVAHMYMAIIRALEGDHAASEGHARLAIDRSANVPPVLCEAKAVLARALVAQGRAREALAPAGEAMRLLDELGTIEEGEAMVRLAYAEVLSATQDPAAPAAVASARARVHARAEKIRDARWRRSFLENVPEVRATLVLDQAAPSRTISES